VLLKTAADQIVWAPIMTCVFFAVLKSLEGHPELIIPTIQVRSPPPPWARQGKLLDTHCRDAQRCGDARSVEMALTISGSVLKGLVG
jgi:hypothetical protein